MSTSEKEPKKLHISIDIAPPSYLDKDLALALSLLEIYDPEGRMIYRGPAATSLSLDKGIYRTRLILGDQFNDELLALDEASKELYTLSMDNLSTNIQGLDFNPDQNNLQKNDRIQPWNLNTRPDEDLAGVSITVCHADFRDYYSINEGELTHKIYSNLKIIRAVINENGYDDASCLSLPMTDSDSISMTFAINIAPGNYRLQIDGKNGKPKWLPLQLFRGFECKIFISWNKIFSANSISLFYADYEKFQNINAQDAVKSILINDYILKSLHANIKSPKISVRDLEKFYEKNPLNNFTAIFFLYLLIRNGEEPSREIEIFIKNLGKVILGSSDLAAIRCFFARSHRGYRELTKTDIPMVQLGADILYEGLFINTHWLKLFPDAEAFYIGRHAGPLWSVSGKNIVRFTKDNELQFFASGDSGISHALHSDFSGTLGKNESKWLESVVMKEFEKSLATSEDTFDVKRFVEDTARQLEVLPTTVRNIIRYQYKPGIRLDFR